MISQEQKKELRRRVPGFLTEEEPLALKTAYKIGGAAALYLQPESVEDLKLALQTLAELELSFMVLGGGRNILITDVGVQSQVVISLEKGFGNLEIIGADSWSVMLRVESGVRFSQLIKLSSSEGYGGFEKLAGIPGTVGGALVMNAGAYGSTIYDCLAALQIMEKGRLIWRQGSQIKPEYRDGGLLSGQVVVAAYFLLEKKDPGEIKGLIAEIKGLREKRLPGGAHAGSVFKNPAGDYAGRLLEESGCKGLRSGGAYVSEEHANVIVAENDAQAADIIALMDKMRLRVRDRYAIELESEIKIFS